MRIVYVSQGYTVHDRRFLEVMADCFAETVFVTFDAVQADLPGGVRHVRLSQPKPSPETVPELQQLFRTIQPAIVQAGPLHTAASVCAQAGFPRLVSMSWAWDLLWEAERRPASRRMAQYALRHSWKVICDCDAVRHRIDSLVSMPPGDILQFPWGIDHGRFHPDPESRRRMRAKLGLTDEIVILSTRSWELLYSIPELLDAFRMVHRTRPNLRLLLLGGGSLAGEIHAKIGRDGLSSAVITPGIIMPEDLPAYYHSADIYVSPAAIDGTSISLLEAMACGLPAVAFDVGGNAEWLGGIAGNRLVPEANWSVYGTAIRELANLSAGQRAAIGDENRRKARDRANWSDAAQLLAALYRGAGQPGGKERHVAAVPINQCR